MIFDVCLSALHRALSLRFNGVMQNSASAQPNIIELPDITAVCVNAKQASIFTTDGEMKSISFDAARMQLHKQHALVCHGPFTRKRLGLDELFTFDVLELYAFVHPVRFCVPTPVGLCQALGLDAPEDFEELPYALHMVARKLLEDLREDPYNKLAPPDKIAKLMGLQGKGWNWAPYVLSALGEEYNPKDQIFGKTSLNVWKHMKEWSEDAPEPPADHFPVSEDEAQERLEKLLNAGGNKAEVRPQQITYTRAMSHAFAPVQNEDEPHIVLSEAGTGVGKTLGYLAPASVWAEKNQGSVWVSTYTKNLQRQIDAELDRLFPDSDVKDTHVAIRKGRENYLCLLNFEDLAAGAALARHPDHAVGAGIMARWSAATKDGDLSGADFPGWIPGLIGYRHTTALADRRGECIFSACDHYHRCFVEKSVRQSKRARIVVANHALVMIQAALSAPGEDLPSRTIFDEGHHLFSAADSAFAAHLSARETRDLRRWILGAEGGKQSRARGLKRRIEDLMGQDAEAEKLLLAIVKRAESLTAEGWARRLRDEAPSGPCEDFLHKIYKQVYARADGSDGPYSLETPCQPLNDDVLDDAMALKKALQDLQKPMQAMINHIRGKLAQDGGDMESDMRRRLDSTAQGLERRSSMTLSAWIQMLETLKADAMAIQSHNANSNQAAPLSATNAKPHALGANAYTGANAQINAHANIQSSPHPNAPQNAPPVSTVSNGGAPPKDFVDWLEIDRMDGRAIDVGYYRHWVDPMKPFANTIRPHIHGIGITSATLRDNSEDSEESWLSARRQSGSQYLGKAQEHALISPFNYKDQTKVFIINDVRKDDVRQVAGAYGALFEAAGGGALGLFTAIQRLRATYDIVAPHLEDMDIPLYAQHVDEIDTGSLVDMFREDERACLLGTDAVRDGVDVPGDSLKLIIFDRVPWPRPTILHKARREAFGGRGYDEMITRMKIKQAFGRLVRRADDKGVFVMMDGMFPSRLHNAFPKDVEIVKCGLRDAKIAISQFF